MKTVDFFFSETIAASDLKVSGIRHYFIAIITSASKIEDFKFVYCCFMKISN